MNFGFGTFGGFGWIFMILWWILIIAGIVALIKWLTREPRSNNNYGNSAIDVLKERYAKGDIDKKEYEEKKKDLES
ncbi:MAG: electron transporter RnfE [Candidatus Taylorbacteria bacterium RIFCSPHIGHO2_02_FULL_47_18]|nr:MAG: electron transporter RnfE [Candidatus Taylorbacteria bacterium RIFCSPHIGHO2_01_FULL_48_38]OHA28592.1 MAG: electron transporter RnfE [Candidatus Taylorbacteria bacterium RIFCSPHIGHO2_02_FULL_47_18]OHA40264.1 MAG: electron transporter RnfE [Candidatus Taylorbacteria bacterium RIFCSPLOWO2_02_FULL_48_16]OHA45557.1 MAG: electron transporter RnfE [Candidatus Taylorbacteria bacterium RIFCSPLOWO2_12_FULL_48_11]